MPIKDILDRYLKDMHLAAVECIHSILIAANVISLRVFKAYHGISIFLPINILASLESDDADWANAVPGAKEFWERIPSVRGTAGSKVPYFRVLCITKPRSDLIPMNRSSEYYIIINLIA